MRHYHVNIVFSDGGAQSFVVLATTPEVAGAMAVDLAERGGARRVASTTIHTSTGNETP